MLQSSGNESKEARRKRFILRRRAPWAHVKKRGPKQVGFKRFWRRSSYRFPPRDLADMSRKERRALAKSMWKTQQAIQKRGAARG